MDKGEQPVQIKTAAEIPVAALEDFYDQMFPDRAAFLKLHWRWLYRVGTYDSVPAPLVLTSGDQVIGHAALLPALLRRGHEERVGAWLVDFAILPGCQRKGLGSLLTQEAMRRCPLLLGFCNERSLGTLLRCGWKTRTHTRSFQTSFRPEYHPSILNSPWRFVGLLAGKATRIVYQARARRRSPIEVTKAKGEDLAAFSDEELSETLHVSRSPDFLQWRISLNPFADEHFVLKLSSTDAGRCMGIARVVDAGGYQRLHLLTLKINGAKKSLLQAFFASLVWWALNADIDHILLLASDPRVVRAARLWFPVSKPLRFIYHSTDPDWGQALDIAAHSWELIDNDFDLTFVSHQAGLQVS